MIPALIFGWLLLIAPLVILTVYEVLPHSPLQPFLSLSFDPARLESTAQDYFLAALFSVHLIGLSAVSSTFAPWLERYSRSIRWIAGATFSLYLGASAHHAPVSSKFPVAEFVTVDFISSTHGHTYCMSGFRGSV